jgi:signal transduction histidine kinase
VTINLLSNALKFSRKGGIVELSSEYVRHDGKKFIQVTVKDNGLGIKKEDKPKLFNVFGKVKQRSSQLNREGIGLGLNICKQICDVFGGYIDFDSIEDIGSKFFFAFEIFENRDTSFLSIKSEVLSEIN